jgi:drug/metabolite transporter (DMT)-like permease
MPDKTEDARANRTVVLAGVACGVTLLLWASAFVVIRHIGEDVSPATLTVGRLVVAAIALAPFVVRRGWVRPSAREWLLLVTCGVGWFGVYNLTLNAGERRIDAGTAALIVQVGPIIVALAATVLFGERMTRWLGIGMLVGFAGVVLIAQGSRTSGQGDLVGVLLVLVAAVMYAVGVMSQKPLLARIPGVQVVFTCFVVGALVCAPWAGGLGSAVSHPNDLVWIVYLGVFPTAIGFSTWAFALRHSDVGKLSLTTFLVPFIATVIAWITLDEVPPALSFLGGVVAIAGVLLTRRRAAAR